MPSLPKSVRAMAAVMEAMIGVARNPRDVLSRFYLMRSVGKIILPEYRYKWPQMVWWDNERFNDYLETFGELAHMNTDRRWILYQFLRIVEAVPGDTAECGVYHGASSYLICSFTHQSRNYRRTHFMFDSFEGLSAPSSLDGDHWRAGALAWELDDVKRRLAKFQNLSWHKGWIPERFVDVEDRDFAFVHIDVDLYQPTLDSINFFYDRMNSGGVIICDDYGFTSCPGATLAIDEYLSDKAEKMIPLSCGGGFMIKGCQTAASFDI